MTTRDWVIITTIRIMNVAVKRVRTGINMQSLNSWQVMLQILNAVVWLLKSTWHLHNQTQIRIFVVVYFCK